MSDWITRATVDESTERLEGWGARHCMPTGETVVAPLVIPLGIVIATGVGTAAKGFADMVHANKTAKSAQRDHKDAVGAVEACQSRTHNLAEDYGKDQLRAQAETIGRFASWLESITELAKSSPFKDLGNVEFVVNELKQSDRTWKL